jgi:hypothetical protein
MSDPLLPTPPQPKQPTPEDAHSTAPDQQTPPSSLGAGVPKGFTTRPVDVKPAADGGATKADTPTSSGGQQAPLQRGLQAGAPNQTPPGPAAVTPQEAIESNTQKIASAEQTHTNAVGKLGEDQTTLAAHSKQLAEAKVTLKTADDDVHKAQTTFDKAVSAEKEAGDKQSVAALNEQLNKDQGRVDTAREQIQAHQKEYDNAQDAGAKATAGDALEKASDALGAATGAQAQHTAQLKEALQRATAVQGAKDTLDHAQTHADEARGKVSDLDQTFNTDRATVLKDQAVLLKALGHDPDAPSQPKQTDSPLATPKGDGAKQSTNTSPRVEQQIQLQGGLGYTYTQLLKSAPQQPGAAGVMTQPSPESPHSGALTFMPAYNVKSGQTEVTLAVGGGLLYSPAPGRSPWGGLATANLTIQYDFPIGPKKK